MRTIVTICLWLVLAGCAPVSDSSSGGNSVRDNGQTNRFTEILQRARTHGVRARGRPAPLFNFSGRVGTEEAEGAARGRAVQLLQQRLKTGDSPQQAVKGLFQDPEFPELVAIYPDLPAAMLEMVQSLMTPEQKRATDDAKCREFGFKPETEAYGNCRLKLEQIRVAERANRKRQRLKLKQIRATERATDATKRAADATEQANRKRRAEPSTLGGGQGMSLLCKDAISRGDRGGTFTFC